jgi:hypothetical protein
LSCWIHNPVFIYVVYYSGFLMVYSEIIHPVLRIRDVYRKPWFLSTPDPNPQHCIHRWFNLYIIVDSVLRIRIRGTVSGVDKNQDPGWTSRIRNTVNSTLFALLDPYYIFLLV